MSQLYKVYDDKIPHHVSSTVVGSMDALSIESYKEIICKSLMFCVAEKGLKLHAYVIMSNEFQFIVSAASGLRIVKPNK